MRGKVFDRQRPDPTCHARLAHAIEADGNSIAITVRFVLTLPSAFFKYPQTHILYQYMAAGLPFFLLRRAAKKKRFRRRISSIRTNKSLILRE